MYFSLKVKKKSHDQCIQLCVYFWAIRKYVNNNIAFNMNVMIWLDDAVDIIILLDDNTKGLWSGWMIILLLSPSSMITLSVNTKYYGEC